MNCPSRILKRVTKALDRAIVSHTATGSDCWAVGWSRAYRAAIGVRGVSGGIPPMKAKRNGIEGVV